MGRMATNASRHHRDAPMKRPSQEMSPSSAYMDDDEFDPWDETLWDEIAETERELRSECPTAEELSALSDSIPIRGNSFSRRDFET